MERLMEDRKSFSEINDFEQFYAAYTAQFKKDVRSIIDISHMPDIARYTDIDLMSSLFNDSCIESAARFSKGGAKYNFCNRIAVAIVNAADALVSRIAQSLNSFVQDRIAARGGRYTFGRADREGIQRR